MAQLSLEPDRSHRLQRKIVVADIAGFCFGVRRAVELTEKARHERPARLTTIGDLVHNSHVIERLRNIGVDRSAALADVTDGTVVLSAHGSAPSVLREARDRGLEVLDVTCPFVTKVHRAAKGLAEQGYFVLLVGDRGHTETIGVIAAVEEMGGQIRLVSSAAEVGGIATGKRVGVVCQTTQRSDTFAEVVAAACKLAPDVRAMNTVCNATEELQEAASRLASKVDVVIVVGGSRSANTRRLRDVCAEAGTRAYHIESAEDLDMNWLAGTRAVGLTAGASTPDWLLEDVARKINGGVLPEDWRVRHPDT